MKNSPAIILAFSAALLIVVASCSENHTSADLRSVHDGDFTDDSDSDFVNDSDFDAGFPRVDGDIENDADNDEPEQHSIRLWHEVPLDSYSGSFVSLGDLDGDSKIDLLLYRMARLSTPGLIVALDHEGEILWELGDSTLTEHTIVEPNEEPPCRGISFVFDIDDDERAEVITEYWAEDIPMILILDGETGEVERQEPSPFDLSVRLPDGYSPWRGHAVGGIAWLDGSDGEPSIVLKYGSSNRIPGHVVALSPGLEIRWHTQLDPGAVGHIPTIFDIDRDGRDEIVAGQAVVDDDGSVLWQAHFGSHADMTTVFDLHPHDGPEVLMSICQTGPAYCLSSTGETLWSLPRDIVSHGQGIWAGNFLPEREGYEVIILGSGHSGEFLTVEGESGEMLNTFSHNRAPVQAYPDLPSPIHWTGQQLLWVPADRSLVDGQGVIQQDLEPHDLYVTERLHPGFTKDTLAVQAFVLDICGDSRQELILYHPYAGESVLIFSQPGDACFEKPYVHDEAAYNIRSYF